MICSSLEEVVEVGFVAAATGNYDLLEIPEPLVRGGGGGGGVMLQPSLPCFEMGNGGCSCS